MTPLSRTTVGCVCLLTLAACAVRRPITGSGGLSTITEIEIRKSDAEDVLELIEDLRPSWILGSPVRDPGNPLESPAGPGVLINDVPVLPLYALQFEPLEGIKEIRHLTRTSAENRYRVSAPRGLIVVIRPPRVGPDRTTPPDTGRASGSITASGGFRGTGKP